MTTTFSLLVNRCGLSTREAAEFLDARVDTVKSWSSGRNKCPAGVIDQLRDLYASIEAAADNHIAAVKHLIETNGAPEEIEISIAADDDEARTLGFPCAGVHGAVIGIVTASIDVPVVVVPRGSTVATAGAAGVA